MQLNLLETFRAVIEQGSTQAAAKTLGITQSAVSRRISQLEAELKLELFRRDKGRLIPTRECHALQGKIFGMVDRGQQLQHLAGDLKRGNSPAIRLRIAVPASLTLSILPRIIRAILTKMIACRSSCIPAPMIRSNGCFSMIGQSLGFCGSLPNARGCMSCPPSRRIPSV